MPGTSPWNLSQDGISRLTADIYRQKAILMYPPLVYPDFDTCLFQENHDLHECASAARNSYNSVLNLRSLRLLVTTKTLLKAIAPAASIGLSSPNAAAGIRITL